VLGLDFQKLFDEQVIVVIGNLGLIESVIEMVMSLNLTDQLVIAGTQFRRRPRGTSGFR
jgi:hypothetical protein